VDHETKHDIVLLSVTYAFCLRTLRIRSIRDAEPHDARLCRELFAQAVPFLTDRQSTVRLKNVQESIDFVQSRLKEPLRNVSSFPILPILHQHLALSYQRSILSLAPTLTSYSAAVRCHSSFPAFFGV
jgi:hypothetical protein